MGTRGPKSAASLTVVRPGAVERVARIRPPAWLASEAAAEFRSIVADLSADHFRPSDGPLLARYAECIVACNAAADVETFCKLARLQSTLAVRLRICPSSRGDHRKAAKSHMPGRNWESEIDG